MPKLIEDHRQRESVAEAPQTAGLVRIAAWEQYRWLRAGFSTRLGGESSAYGHADLNLGWTASDSRETVSRNRQRFVSSLKFGSAANLVTVRQFHSNLVVHISAQQMCLETAEGDALLRGDGIVTDQRNLLLAVQTADCVPVLVADVKRKIVGAFHAGWRGTLARIVERGIGDLRLRYGSKSEDIVAAIGPCIGSCCFTVGEEVRSLFASRFAYGSQLFSEVNGIDAMHEEHALMRTTLEMSRSRATRKINLDLTQANRRQLLDAGVSAENITLVQECTACKHLANGRRKYFSHRAERGFTGRMLSVIGVVRE